MTIFLESQLKENKLRQTLEDLAELGQMAIRNPHLALPLILVACGLNQQVAASKTPEVSATSPQITDTATETLEIPEDTETPSIITTEGQLFPTEWEQRYQLSFSDSLSNPEVYDQLSQILADNAAKILADDTQGIRTCGAAGPPIPENSESQWPATVRFDFTGAHIAAISALRFPEGTSYIVTLSCKGLNPAEVSPVVFNLYFSYDFPDVDNTP
jgi:hypothetical protein